MDLATVERRLRDGLARGLPGAEAQLRLAPAPRSGWRPGRVPSGCRPAAALVLLYPVDGATRLVLTVRRSDLPQHAGQVSLPGGAVEPGETVEAAALREAHEEIDLAPRVVRVAGRLSPLHVPVSRFVLHPVVATAARRPAMRPAEREVARILEPSLDELAGPRAVALEVRRRGGRELRVPYIAVDGERLWGATAMVLAELLTLLGRPPSPPPGAQRTP